MFSYIKIYEPLKFIDMEEEVWRKIEGFSDFEVSSLGRVRTLERDVVYSNGRVHHYDSVIRKIGHGNGGYMKVRLHDDNHKIHDIGVHRLVGLAFIPNPDNLPLINHKNEVKDDNRVENLEWCSSKYNNNYGHSREKRSIALKGHSVSEKTRRKISEANKGRTHSDEAKRKMSQSHRAFYNDPERSREARKKISESSKSRTHSEETRKKLSQARRAYEKRKKESLEVTK